MVVGKVLIKLSTLGNHQVNFVDAGRCGGDAAPAEMSNFLVFTRFQAGATIIGGNHWLSWPSLKERSCWVPLAFLASVASLPVHIVAPAAAASLYRSLMSGALAVPRHIVDLAISLAYEHKHLSQRILRNTRTNSRCHPSFIHQPPAVDEALQELLHLTAPSSPPWLFIIFTT